LKWHCIFIVKKFTQKKIKSPKTQILVVGFGELGTTATCTTPQKNATVQFAIFFWPSQNAALHPLNWWSVVFKCATRQKKESCDRTIAGSASWSRHAFPALGQGWGTRTAHFSLTCLCIAKAIRNAWHTREIVGPACHSVYWQRMTCVFISCVEIALQKILFLSTLICTIVHNYKCGNIIYPHLF